MADITLTDEQIAQFEAAAVPILQLIRDFQHMYIETEFEEDKEPFDPDAEPPQPHVGKPHGYLQVLTTRAPIPSATVGQIPGPVAPNRLDEHPSDQRFSPADLHWIFPKMPFAFSVFTREREGKPFYAVNFYARIDGNLFQHTKEILPELPEPIEERAWSFVDETPDWIPHC